MSSVGIEVSHVWKKFRRGEVHDSLRDLIPSVASVFLGRKPSRSDENEFWALRDVSFEVRKGEAFGIIGPNGAGKSTMLKLLSRILRANRGRIQVNGKLSALLELGAGFHWDLTGRENVYINGSILGLRRRQIDEKFDAIVDFSGIRPFIDTPVKRYSTGMTQRLAFAVAAHMEPDVLLVDEVLSVGDATFRKKCIDRMEALIRSDASVVFVSHNLEQVRELCDRCLVLDQGQIRFVGDTASACEIYYDCAEQLESGGGAGTGNPDQADPFRIIGVSICESDGNALSTIPQFTPVVIQIEYELYETEQDLNLTVGFETCGRVRAVSCCDSEADGFGLPNSPGVHRLQLQVDGMPYAQGEYQMITILSRPSGEWTKSLRWISMRGLSDTHRRPVILAHRWAVADSAMDAELHDHAETYNATL